MLRASAHADLDVAPRRPHSTKRPRGCAIVRGRAIVRSTCARFARPGAGPSSRRVRPLAAHDHDATPRLAARDDLHPRVAGPAGRCALARVPATTQDANHDDARHLGSRGGLPAGSHRNPAGARGWPRWAHRGRAARRSPPRLAGGRGHAARLARRRPEIRSVGSRAAARRARHAACPRASRRAGDRPRASPRARAWIFLGSDSLRSWSAGLLIDLVRSAVLANHDAPPCGDGDDHACS